ncbi:hypothetical protein ABIA39_004368 [Nocardia sp. GAS34]|uniref:WXG100 family type VII secretion target n=1 Tax=unclassified Nocardia TaxID=2637762 RepID=UPI003D1EC1CF
MAGEKKVRVNTHELRVAAGTMNDAGGRVKNVFDTLRNHLHSKGNPFGNDDYGHKFTEGEKGYDTSSKNLLSGGDNMTDSLDKFGSGMTDAAKKMDDMDH